jgi:hypothetical protein
MRASAATPVVSFASPSASSLGSEAGVSRSERTRASTTAASAAGPAQNAKAIQPVVIETSKPATSGPTSVATLSIVEVVALAATSSAGVRASEGSSACSVGRMSVDQSPTTAANA